MSYALTCYTPSFRLATGQEARPSHLARCRVSVAQQTIPVEHYIAWDARPGGSGIAGMYAQVPTHAHRVTGAYVHILADDDVLAGPDVAERTMAIAERHAWPEVLIVCARKAGRILPSAPYPPRVGQIDLGCIICRRDVWQAHVYDYGRRYEGDGDFAVALHLAGRQFLYTDVLFETGEAMYGAPE